MQQPGDRRLEPEGSSWASCRSEKERPEDRYKVLEIRALRNMPRREDAQKLLEQIATQVQPIMIKHKWRVHLLSEFWPEQASLVGLNVKHGLHIKLRLRRADNQDEFIPTHNILDTMLHELCHNDHHSSDFKNLFRKERDMERQQPLLNQWPLLFIILVLRKVYDIVAKGRGPLGVIVFLVDLCMLGALEKILFGSFTSAGPMLPQLARRVATFVQDRAHRMENHLRSICHRR